MLKIKTKKRWKHTRQPKKDDHQQQQWDGKAIAVFYDWAISPLPPVHDEPHVRASVLEGPSGFDKPLDHDEVWDRSSSMTDGIWCHTSCCRVLDLQHLSRVGYWQEGCPTWWRESGMWWLWSLILPQSVEGLVLDLDDLEVEEDGWLVQ